MIFWNINVYFKLKNQGPFKFFEKLPATENAKINFRSNFKKIWNLSLWQNFRTLQNILFMDANDEAQTICLQKSLCQRRN